MLPPLVEIPFLLEEPCVTSLPLLVGGAFANVGSWCRTGPIDCARSLPTTRAFSLRASKVGLARGLFQSYDAPL